MIEFPLYSNADIEALVYEKYHHQMKKNSRWVLDKFLAFARTSKINGTVARMVDEEIPPVRWFKDGKNHRYVESTKEATIWHREVKQEQIVMIFENWGDVVKFMCSTAPEDGFTATLSYPRNLKAFELVLSVEE